MPTASGHMDDRLSEHDGEWFKYIISLSIAELAVSALPPRVDPIVLCDC